MEIEPNVSEFLGEQSSPPGLEFERCARRDMSAYIPANRNRWPVNIKPLMRWKHDPNTPAFGLYADVDRCLIGDNFGRVVEITPDGKLQNKYELPTEVLCIKRDDDFLYAGCNDGSMHDITQGEPRLVATVESFDIVTAMDARDGMICVCDHRHLALANCEGEVIWKKRTGNGGRVVCIDGKSVYHGNDNGVTRYAISGKRLWRRQITWFISAIQKDVYVYVASPYNVYKLYKRNGKIARKYEISSGLYLGINSACIEVGDEIIFVTTRNSISCYDDVSGRLIYVLDTVNIEPLAMSYHAGLLYCSSCTCCMLDLRMGAINNARSETQPAPITVDIKTECKTLNLRRKIESVPEVKFGESGVIVHCVKEWDKLRVRPLSYGYHAGWNCQFPSDIKREGGRYLVDRLIAGPGKFYRAFGAIKQIEVRIKAEHSASHDA